VGVLGKEERLESAILGEPRKLVGTQSFVGRKIARPKFTW